MAAPGLLAAAAAAAIAGGMELRLAARGQLLPVGKQSLQETAIPNQPQLPLDISDVFVRHSTIPARCRSGGGGMTQPVGFAGTLIARSGGRFQLIAR
jgi:hypothetical protein